MSFCEQCFEKQRKIDRLEDEIISLKAKLRYQQRTIQEGFFGSSTSSSKKPAKPNSPAERQAKRGGARLGHPGRGRKPIPESELDERQWVPAETVCPDCGGALRSKGTYRRNVIDIQPATMKRRLIELERKHCLDCGRRVEAQAPGVFPKSLYGNAFISHVAVQHFLYGQTLGQLEKQIGVGHGALINTMHQLSHRLENVMEQLVRDYRNSPVRHADETGWRTDGANGYAWLFCTPETSLFRLRQTRSAQVPREVFGDKPLPGVLVVDRYPAYNKIPCHLQYCYAHLLRNVQDLEKDFPDDTEIAAFVTEFAPLLAKAMELTSSLTKESQFKRKAVRLKNKIIALVQREARHPAIQSIQNIFRENKHRLYHWAHDSNIPADNNRAERELRPLVIARKISFGSQSQPGATTRETIMSVLHTLHKRRIDVFNALKNALDQIALNPHLDFYSLLFDSS